MTGSIATVTSADDAVWSQQTELNSLRRFSAPHLDSRRQLHKREMEGEGHAQGRWASWEIWPSDPSPEGASLPERLVPGVLGKDQHSFQRTKAPYASLLA